MKATVMTDGKEDEKKREEMKQEGKMRWITITEIRSRSRRTHIGGLSSDS